MSSPAAYAAALRAARARVLDHKPALERLAGRVRPASMDAAEALLALEPEAELAGASGDSGV